jgi:hypothetical protein
MESALYVSLMLYTILGVLATAFCVWILPCILEELACIIKTEWTQHFIPWLDQYLIDLKEHYQWLEWEQGRHRVSKGEEFSAWLREKIQVEEGFRMPMSIRG